MVRFLRFITVCLSVAIGTFLIGQLWMVSLDTASLIDAGRGVLFLLVALGLIGEQRLGLALSALICLPTVVSTPLSGLTPLVISAQYALLGASLVLLFAQVKRDRTTL
ncbi:hypothetical protein N9V36_07030 [Luminiphilus sp.]|nr:hypothetical protein [Luminiphilus sp.]MDA8754341.1 hypothetical protein [Luminiphilus sp.]MDB2313858.1 hypothetical protein [Luminiphilus sp.]MDB2317061.1 hypothetical protein [Luminiphilus sp.]MDB2441392.1 hypothetical protein [Luminiphilus sp.]